MHAKHISHLKFSRLKVSWVGANCKIFSSEISTLTTDAICGLQIDKVISKQILAVREF